jgi:CheY-like chemotaxis protein/KaiC/GvpD/RAD55 family RecA-like ATPase
MLMEMESAKILIAEDEPFIALVLETLLSEQGFRVAVASDGEQALAKAKSERPALLLLDLMMPKKDGYEVCRALREDPEFSLLPIIMLTAKGQPSDRLLGFEVGADDYIVKPFDPGELVARVRAVLRRRPVSTVQSIETSSDLSRTGVPALDQALGGGLPKGSNLLLVGPIGSGKSRFARTFMASGLEAGEVCLFLSVDDNPVPLRRELDAAAGGTLASSEQAGLFRLVDAYSWCAGGLTTGERFAVTGILELTQLSGVVSDAAAELGQTARGKRGGRRVVDSISSLLVTFELSSVQRFVAHLARSAAGFGGVSTLFIVEEGSVGDQVLNNIRYVMDGVLEFKTEGTRRFLRVASMKWRRASPNWIDITVD